MTAIIFNEAFKSASAGVPPEEIIDPESEVPVKRQCELLGVSRSTFYYKPVKKDKASDRELEKVMADIDTIHTKHPFYGARKISKELSAIGHKGWGRKRTKTQMDKMRIYPVYPRPNTSRPGKQSAKFPYLLKGKRIWLPNQVWATDITYVRLGATHMYLTAFIDWHSRMIVGWELSDTLEAAPVVECMEKATEEYGIPCYCNSDQGAQFGADDYVLLLSGLGIRQSMDGRGRWVENVIIERWFRSLKSECLYINEYNTPRELRRLVAGYVDDYNNDRIHESLGYATPSEVYYSAFKMAA